MVVRSEAEIGKELRRQLIREFGNPFGKEVHFEEFSDFEGQQLHKLAVEAARKRKQERNAFLASI